MSAKYGAKSILNSCTYKSILHQVHIDFFLLHNSKCKNKCPGCGTPKDLHNFAAMGKHCEGPKEPDPDSDSIMDDTSLIEEEKSFAPLSSDKQYALLQPIRALLSQVEALQFEQQTLRDTVTELKTTEYEIGACALTHEPSARADSNDINSLQEEQQPPSGPNSGSGHQISGTILKAVKASAYVNFIDLLPGPKVKHDTCGNVISGTGNQESERNPELNYRIIRLVAQSMEHLRGTCCGCQTTLLHGTRPPLGRDSESEQEIHV